MTSTWVVGDIHGCADELATLLQRIDLQECDRFISVGDLYHRGPDPIGVAEQLGTLKQFELVLGNHERVLLERMHSLPNDADLNGFDALDLAGDGGTQMQNFDSAKSGKLLSLLKTGTYFLRGENEGVAWIVVHAGVVPGRRPEDCSPFELTRMRQISIKGRDHFWSELWQGPELVIYGHTSHPQLRPQFAGDKLLALGIDTGCVYGGALTAYRIEDGETVQVEANRRYC